MGGIDTALSLALSELDSALANAQQQLPRTETWDARLFARALRKAAAIPLPPHVAEKLRQRTAEYRAAHFAPDGPIAAAIADAMEWAKSGEAIEARPKGKDATEAVELLTPFRIWLNDLHVALKNGNTTELAKELFGLGHDVAEGFADWQVFGAAHPVGRLYLLLAEAEQDNEGRAVTIGGLVWRIAADPTVSAAVLAKFLLPKLGSARNECVALLRQFVAWLQEQLPAVAPATGGGEADDLVAPQLNRPNGAKRAKSNARKMRRRKVPSALTAKQTEAVQLFGECKGNIAEVARQMRISRATAQQHVNAAHTKLGHKALAPKTGRLKTDRRGQSDLIADDDHRR